MKYKRIIAVGDIHGDYNKLVKILTNAKLIDHKKNWIGKDSILVQIGDLVDRGGDTKDVLDLMIKIKEQAKRKGGIVNVVLGNHEIYNLEGMFRYSFLKDIMAFGNIKDRQEAFSINKKYGKFLRKEMEPVIILDDILFTHAGLLSKYAELGIDNINKKIHDILIDAPYDVLMDPMLKDDGDGPMWTRYYTMNDDEKAVCDELSKVLQMTNTTRMVVGHTIQENGKINTRCDNKLIAIDLGMSKSCGDRYGYLEIKRDNNEFWAIYN
ncbi:Metallo-dependent phosphatase [Anaeromyces robustus]|uniref:Metallo-dependent phosphatase n=1 Tax=Anaeromyces robustus TaxID=1754192 RepID=A0A1Y1XBX1_9FUNG|nr:Metallo-dependent phosphatase [Anaeromyces robustus]|eukprot:ORX83239.1 Metallo-dependent phosphatase [Anaeromyces robustus]